MLMQESFDRGQELIFTPTGRSMLPMLDGERDKVRFAPAPERLKKYDVVFYRRFDGQLVLHRMIGFDKNGGYIFSGDNQYGYEYGIGQGDILALMTSFTHRGREYHPTDCSYRFYIHRMMVKKRLRRFASKIYHRLFH